MTTAFATKGKITADATKTAKAISFLIGQYTQHGSIARELFANAIESSEEAGSEKKIHIVLPDKKEPRGLDPFSAISQSAAAAVNNFIITDYGTGLTASGLKTNVFALGRSDKRNKERGKMGGHGIGAKSPLFLSPMYTIESRCEGLYSKAVLNLSEGSLAWHFIFEDEPQEGENFFRVIVPIKDDISHSFVEQSEFYLSRMGKGKGEVFTPQGDKLFDTGYKIGEYEFSDTVFPVASDKGSYRYNQRLFGYYNGMPYDLQNFNISNKRLNIPYFDDGSDFGIVLDPELATPLPNRESLAPSEELESYIIEQILSAEANLKEATKKYESKINALILDGKDVSITDDIQDVDEENGVYFRSACSPYFRGITGNFWGVKRFGAENHYRKFDRGQGIDSREMSNERIGIYGSCFGVFSSLKYAKETGKNKVLFINSIEPLKSASESSSAAKTIFRHDTRSKVFENWDTDKAKEVISCLDDFVQVIFIYEDSFNNLPDLEIVSKTIRQGKISEIYPQSDFDYELWEIKDLQSAIGKIERSGKTKKTSSQKRMYSIFFQGSHHDVPMSELSQFLSNNKVTDLVATYKTEVGEFSAHEVGYSDNCAIVKISNVGATKVLEKKCKESNTLLKVTPELSSDRKWFNINGNSRYGRWGNDGSPCTRVYKLYQALLASSLHPETSENHSYALPDNIDELLDGLDHLVSLEDMNCIFHDFFSYYGLKKMNYGGYVDRFSVGIDKYFDMLKNIEALGSKNEVVG